MHKPSYSDHVHPKVLTATVAPIPLLGKPRTSHQRGICLSLVPFYVHKYAFLTSLQQGNACFSPVPPSLAALGCAGLLTGGQCRVSIRRAVQEFLSRGLCRSFYQEGSAGFLSGGLCRSSYLARARPAPALARPLMPYSCAHTCLLTQLTPSARSHTHLPYAALVALFAVKGERHGRRGVRAHRLLVPLLTDGHKLESLVPPTLSRLVAFPEPTHAQ